MARLDRIIVIARHALFAAVVFLVIVYAADHPWARYRTAGDELGTLTYYYATALKNGRLEIFYNQPQTEVCIRSIFPHAGYRPCWYAARDRVRTVS